MIEKQNDSVYSKSIGRLNPIIRKYPLVLYFILSILFTWVIDFIMVGWLKQDPYTYTLIAAFGPVLSAMFLMSFLEPEREKTCLRSRIIVFVVVLVLAGVLRWISRIWWNHDLTWNVIPGDAILVILSAFVASGAFSGKKGVRELLQPVFNWRVSWIWYVFALAFWPTLTLIGNMLAELIHIPVPSGPELPDASIFIVIPVSFFWALLFNGAMQEEAGWRGFALPKLQHRYSPLIASLILGFLWGVYHWSGFFIGYRGSLLSFWIRLGDIGLAVVFTWLFNRLKGKSLLPLFLLHASMNATNDFLPRTKIIVYTMLGIVILVMIFTDRMWKRLPEIKENGQNTQVKATESNGATI